MLIYVFHVHNNKLFFMKYLLSSLSKQVVVISFIVAFLYFNSVMYAQNIPTSKEPTSQELRSDQKTDAEKSKSSSDAELIKKTTLSNNVIKNQAESKFISEPGPPFNTENLTAGFGKKTQIAISTDEITGSLNYSYDIQIPPGRNGFQPDIKLKYNNQQAGISANIVGYGWDVEIPYISKINKSGTDKLYSSDYYYSSLSGELVNVSGNTYAPKVENGEFLTYSFSNGSWIVKDKSGTSYKFGNTTASRQDNPNKNIEVYKWMIAEIRNKNDNYIKYEYYKNVGQIYPDKITYTGNGSTDGIFKIEFLRESRNDNFKSYATAFLTETNYRISEIKISVNGIWVKKYKLNYISGDNGLRSLLLSIGESGNDEYGTIDTLPPTLFSYYEATPGWTLDIGTWTSPTPFANGFQSMLDVNGDALPDVIESHQVYCNPGQGVFKNTYINNNNGTWSLNNNLQSPILFRDCEVRGGAYQNVWDQGVRIGDLNGDQLPDIIRGEDNSNNRGGFDAYINTNGTSWVQNSTWQPTVTFNGDDNIHSWGSHLLDLNSDGLPDIIRKQGEYFGSQINEGAVFGVESSSAWNLPLPVELPGPKARIVDLNGDILPDVIYMNWNPSKGGYDQYTYLNNGKGNWILDNTGDWNLPVEVVEGPNATDSGARFFDINADGLPDLVPDAGLVYKGRDTYLNNGSGWTCAHIWNVPDDVQINFENDPISIVDINIDGAIDFFITQNSNPPVTKAFVNNTKTPTDALKKITFPQGGFITIDYKNSPKYKDGSGNTSNPNLPLSLTTVNQITTSDGNATSSTESYTYEGGVYYFNAWDDRKLAGFSKITKKDNYGNKTVKYYHQGNATNSSQGEFADHVSKIGKVYRTEYQDSLGKVYEVTLNKWDKFNLGTNRDFINLARTTILTYDGDSDHKDLSTTYIYDNSNGNLTQQVNWGEVMASNDGSFTDTGADKITSDIMYSTNQAEYILALPKQETIINESGVKVRESKYYYDDLAFGTVNKGNITKEEKWKTGNLYISTKKTYDGTFGLVTSEKDPRDKATTFSYDSYNLYPLTIINPLSQVISYLYDYSLGKPKQVTDQNNFVYQLVYDGLDRIKEEKVPNLTSPYSPVTKTSFAYTNEPNAFALQKTDYLDASNSLNTYQYFDGLNRLIQERIEAEESGKFNSRDIIYNSIGLVSKESLPYTSIGSAKTSSTSNNSLFTTLVYDPIKRVSMVTNAVGTTMNVYDDWKTTVTDPNGKVKNYYNDAYKHLMRVDEINGSNTYITKYEWNGNNNLTKITDAIGNIRNFTYDGLGRRLSAEDLHASGDNTYGIWTYNYDDAGNLKATLDPKGQTVNLTYNDINQVLTEDYTGAAGIEITYTYGGCLNGVGKLCNVSMSTGVNTSFSYNSNNSITSEVKTINGANYQTSYTYDRQGNILEIINPDNSSTRYSYNSAGLPEKIENKESGANYTDLVTNFDYGPHRKVIKQKNGNLTETIKTYDASKMYRLKRILTNSYAHVGQTSILPQNPFITSKTDKEIPKNLDELKLNAINTVKSFQSNAYGDGDIFATSTNWKTVREASSGYAAPLSTTGYAAVQWWGSNNPKEINRMALSFNTSELPDDATVTSAKLKLYVWTLYNAENDGNDFIRVVQNTTTSSTNLIDDDYDQIGILNNPTPGASDVDLGAITENSYLNIYLNSTGLSWINKTGWTKIGLREGHDIMDDPLNAPGGSGIRIYTSNYDVNYAPYLEVTYAIINQAPIASTGLKTEGETNPLEVFDNTPEFTAIYNDPNIVDTAISYRIQVSKTTNFSSPIWDSGQKVLSTPIGRGTEISPISYGGPPFALDGTIYYWRIKFWDDENAEGDWSLETASFTMYNSAIDVLQDLNFTYDSNGNIIKIVDASETETYKTVNYTIDDLNRLINAIASGVAPGQSTYNYAYTYNAIGNIITSPLGTYTYSGSGYYNPHAVTSINSLTCSYDNNGNQITNGTKNRTFDYKNRLISHDIFGSPTTLSFFPQSGDGMVYHNSSSVWTTAHDASNGSSANSTSNKFNVSTGKNSNNKFQLDRAFIPFNTSSIPDNANLISGKLKVYVDSKQNNDNDGNDWISIVQSTQASPTSLVIGDFSKAGNITNPLEGINTNERKDITNVSVNSYLEFNLNQTGLSFISKTSNSYLALREGHDAINSSYVGSANTYNRLSIRSSEYAGTNYDPKLEVVYSPTITETYAYDHLGSRVKIMNPTITTIIPSKYYRKEGATTVKYIYSPDGDVVATIRGSGANALVYNMHADHLSSSEKTTNKIGELVETSDYFPFGQPRISQTTINDRKGYIGKDYDNNTGLSFLEARYYYGNGGQFISQDPVFWDLRLIQAGNIALNKFNGVSESVWSNNFIPISKSNSAIEEYLADPQALNSYAYARNNPLIYNDPDGKLYQIVIGAGLGFVGGFVGQYGSDVINNINSGRSGLSIFAPNSSGKEYAISAGRGALVGAAASIGGIGAGSLTSMLTSIGDDYINGRNIDFQKVAIEGTLTLGTGLTLSNFNKVVGRTPSLFTQAFFFGKHTQTELAKEAISTLTEYNINAASEVTKSVINNKNK